MPFTHRPYQSDDGGPRRLLRSSLRDFKRSAKNNSRAVRPAPPEATSAEAFYYTKQMNAKTPMVIVMTDGEQIRGCIEWYDRNCLKINREAAPNLLIQKHCIKYLFKQEDEVS